MSSNEIIEKLSIDLSDVGIKSGDTLVVFSDTTYFKKTSELSWGDSSSYLKESLLNVLGDEGTLITPAFNWDFCKGKRYRHERSPSQVGLFSSYILKDPFSVRSFHPIYSFSVIGKKVGSIFQDLSNSSFGPGSAFDEIYRSNAKLLNINVKFRENTFIHYIEQAYGIPYRFIKEFSGEYERNGEIGKGRFDFYARFLGKGNTILCLEKLKLSMKERGELATLNSTMAGELILTTAKNMYCHAIEKLKSNANFLLLEPFNSSAVSDSVDVK